MYSSQVLYPCYPKHYFSSLIKSLGQVPRYSYQLDRARVTIYYIAVAICNIQLATLLTSYLYQTPLDLVVHFCPCQHSLILLCIMHACNHIHTYIVQQQFMICQYSGRPFYPFQFLTILAAIYNDIFPRAPTHSPLSELCTKCTACTRQLDSTYHLWQLLQETLSASQGAQLPACEAISCYGNPSLATHLPVAAVCCSGVGTCLCVALLVIASV